MFRNVSSSLRKFASVGPFAVIAMTLAVGAAPAAAQEPKTITIVLTEYKFSPDSITLNARQPVQLNIQNQGKADHNLSSDDLPLMSINYVKADNSPQDLSRYVSTNVLHGRALRPHVSCDVYSDDSRHVRFLQRGRRVAGDGGKFIVVAPGAHAPVPSPSTPAADVEHNGGKGRSKPDNPTRGNAAHESASVAVCTSFARTRSHQA
jgi:cupredoxin-like protein